MDHNQTDELSGSHETHDGDQTGQINDEGQPNNTESETNESNEGAEAQAETRPTRIRTQPSRFKYFVVQVPPLVKHPTSTSNQVASTVCHPISNFVSYDKFSTNHKAFLSAITNNDEPKYFKQVAQDARWHEAMQREIKALEKNRTWTLEDLPTGKRAIDSKWVYKIKFKPNGEVERYKARLVAKGFTQKEGVDYHDTFAPVAKLVIVRTLLAVAVKRDWIIHQLDVNNAFLHGDLDEEVYMKIPQGFSKDGETRVCRMRKSLYGLKQASRNWYHKFTTFLSGLSFRHSKADHSLFIYQTASIMVVVLIYVDDIIITENCLNKIQEIKKQLDKEFSDSGKLGCKPSSFPIEHGLKLDKGENEPSIDASQYHRLIGRLLYLQATRPDITYYVNVLSQFVADPRNNHLEAANRVLRYLKATPGQGILLSRAGDPVLTACCDSDWLGCSFTRLSRTGYFLLLGGSPISWKTKKQSVVSRSSAEAEYKAMASMVSEVIWVRWLLSELQVDISLPTTLFCDNQAARHIANNLVFHERTKHVEMDCYFVRERVESKEIIPMHVSNKIQIADLLTKGLAAQQLQFLLGKIGIANLHAPS
ncbi:putative RNA-directed DNA polymerase [Tanacetum coccineum]